jgi:DNA-binding MarR family transcriptional regulator
VPAATLADAPDEHLKDFGFLLKDVSRLYSRNFERQSAALGLSLAQCRVLAYLERHEGISQARLAELTDTDPMTLARLLARMTADGLVERQADPADRRANQLFLQLPALALLDEIWKLSDQARDQSLQGLSPSESATLTRLLLRMQTNLGALVPGGGDTQATTKNSQTKMAATC